MRGHCYWVWMTFSFQHDDLDGYMGHYVCPLPGLLFNSTAYGEAVMEGLQMTSGQAFSCSIQPICTWFLLCGCILLRLVSACSLKEHGYSNWYFYLQKCCVSFLGFWTLLNCILLFMLMRLSEVS